MNAPRATVLKTVFSFLRNGDRSMKMRILLSFSLTGIMIIFNLSTPFIFKKIIDVIADFDHGISMLAQAYLMLYGSLWTIGQIIGHLRMALMFYVAEHGIKELSLHIFERLQSLSLRFHLERKTGSITSAIERAQIGFEVIFLGLFLFLGPTVIEMIIAIALLLYFYGLFYGCALLVIMALYVTFSVIALGRLEPMRKTYNEKRSQAGARLVDNLLNFETTKYFCNESYDKQLCELALKEQESTGLKRFFYELLIQCGQVLVIGAGLICLTLISGNAVLAKHLTIGDFVLINAYLMQFAIPLHQFGYILRQVHTSFNNMHDIINILQQQPEVHDVPHAIQLKPQHVEVAFETVSFGYEPARAILADVSFSVPAGKTIAIIGHTGSGKSTIARLLFRFYDVNAGRILINGHDIRSIKQQSLRSLIGIVPQDTVLFNNTLRYNIAYGKPDATHYEIEEVVKLARLDAFINSLPDGYETIVGERGLKLSGGERQRVAIARMLLKKPLMYVFDEATSSLDVNTEQEIQHNLRTISEGRTTIIIAHRLSTIMNADEVIVLDHGRIIDRGRPEHHIESSMISGSFEKLPATNRFGRLPHR